ncbi:MAG: DUF29 domain-containing protein [Gloeomargarita sp. SKYBB_i_bin120]|nr:DUF29 domain-containing protein [Gloeomargarita sp. SKYB120]MDW8177912.1 DUF29 domain-containing protein [Gloeomargarita sp. SKYBB_i_bin120]
MPSLVDPKHLYETDYQRWLEQTIAQLRARDFLHLDLENLITELTSLGRSEKHALASDLRRLCEHLLKIKYWEAERARCLRGWEREVLNFRLEIQDLLESSPSLSSYLQEIFPKQYRNGRKLFLQASQIDPQRVPVEPVFTLAQALDEQWLP